MNDMERRVWQRVRGTAEPDTGPEQKQQLLDAMEMAAVYGYLLKNTSDQSRELLRQLREGERANIASGEHSAPGRGTAPENAGTMLSPQPPDSDGIPGPVCRRGVRGGIPGHG